MVSTILITGGSQGIGKETARLFAQNGYNVAIAARQVGQLEAVAAELRQLNVSVLAVPTDVRDPEQVKRLVDRALAEYGAIDVLVNGAGIYISGPAESFSLKDWRQAIDTNLWGYVHTIHFLLPHLIERRSGSIVNISSIGGKVTVPYLSPYCTSKHAVTALTETLHSELAPKGIHVCGIYPNLIKSDLMERAIFRGKDEQDAQARRQQLEQVLQVPVIEKPEDVARAIWDAVKYKKREVVVGSASLSLVSNRLFPGLMQWLFRKTFKLQDQY